MIQDNNFSKLFSMKKTFKSANLFFIIVIVIFCFLSFYLLLPNSASSSNSDINNNNNDLKVIESNIKNAPEDNNDNNINFPLIKKIGNVHVRSNGEFSYSKWPNYLDLSDQQLVNSLNADRDYLQDVCYKPLIDQNTPVSIENFAEIINSLKSSSDKKCIDFYKKFTFIYDVKIKHSKLGMEQELKTKFLEWFKNDNNILEIGKNQKLINVYNKFTNEENVYNTLRPKRPIKKPNVEPEIFFKETMNQTKSDCDLCSEKLTAIGRFGRVYGSHSFSGANLFPFDEYHELFVSRKHDLTEMNFEEFKDFLYLPTKWFKDVNKKNPNLIYPVLLWDFLQKSGASIAHPHTHGTLNEDRYYGIFERIHQGAELYFRETNLNYFNEFTRLHHTLGLSLVHKGSTLVFPIVPTKDFDFLIMSKDFNDGVVELLYSLIRTYINEYKIYPFSMTIYYPSFDSNEKSANGKIPLYLKFIPRGDISFLRSDISTLELMTINNANSDQFLLFKKISTSISNLLKTL